MLRARPSVLRLASLVRARQSLARPRTMATAVPTPSYPKLKLTYFDIKARAEPARLALYIGGVPFEDVRISFSSWPEVKKTTPFGQVPVLEVDGKPLAQSYAILRYAGVLAGLVPTDPFAAAQVDAILASLTDIDVLLAPSGTAPSGTEAEKAAKVALRSALADGALSARFAALDALLAANPSGWLVGDSLTVADLALYGRVGSFVAGKYDGIPAGIVDKYPRVKALYDRVAAHPKVAEWNTAHP